MKKNLRKIPRHIYAKVSNIKNNELVAGCAVRYEADFLSAGHLKHLGISLTPQGLHVPKGVVPLPNRGKYSAWNIHGVTIVRKDLAKQTHYNSVETPNWGDPSYGTHTVELPYEKYPRDFYPPRELEITMSCDNIKPGLPAYVISFKVGETLDKTSGDFSKRLLVDLNLLQENTGFCGVEAADIQLSSYAKSLHVSWEILPPGTLEETIHRLFGGRVPTSQERDTAAERHKFFTELKPRSLVYGSSGFRRYFGALLEDNLVLFENLQYGNAIYILFENWDELSQCSRIDLLSGKCGTDFERVIHRPGWKNAVSEIVARKRTKND